VTTIPVGNSRPPRSAVQVLLLAATLLGAPALTFAAGSGDDLESFPPMMLDQDPKPPAGAAKEEPLLPWRTFELVFGGTYRSVTSTILLNRTSHNQSLAIDAEGVLGMNHEVLSPTVWTAYRLGERHRLEFAFDDITRTATRNIRRDITVDDETYPVGTSVHSELGLQLYALTYIWSFSQDDRMELGLRVSVDLLRTHVEIDIEGPPVVTNERWNLPVPLPGLSADFVLIKDLWLRQRLDLMYVSIQNYSGLFIDLNVALEWSFVKNVSVGLGVDLMRIELGSDANQTSLGNFDGKIKMNSAGLIFYLGLHF